MDMDLIAGEGKVLAGLCRMMENRNVNVKFMNTQFLDPPEKPKEPTYRGPPNYSGRPTIYPSRYRPAAAATDVVHDCSLDDQEDTMELTQRMSTLAVAATTPTVSQPPPQRWEVRFVEPSRSLRPSDNPKREERVKVCHFCMQEGHFYRDCPILQSPSVKAAIAAEHSKLGDKKATSTSVAASTSLLAQESYPSEPQEEEVYENPWETFDYAFAQQQNYAADDEFVTLSSLALEDTEDLDFLWLEPPTSVAVCTLAAPMNLAATQPEIPVVLDATDTKPDVPCIVEDPVAQELEVIQQCMQDL
jgi:hypothetical protein